MKLKKETSKVSIRVLEEGSRGRGNAFWQDLSNEKIGGGDDVGP